jgi:hypothetical protein
MGQPLKCSFHKGLEKLSGSEFMVNVAYCLRADGHSHDLDYSVLDLKADCRGSKYVEETIKLLPEKPVVLENNNGFLTQLLAEGRPLCRSLPESLSASVLVSCQEVGPGEPESAAVQSVRPSAW